LTGYLTYISIPKQDIKLRHVDSISRLLCRHNHKATVNMDSSFWYASCSRVYKINKGSSESIISVSQLVSLVHSNNSLYPISLLSLCGPNPSTDIMLLTFDLSTAINHILSRSMILPLRIILLLVIRSFALESVRWD
jgi:hypothetical protein